MTYHCVGAEQFITFRSMNVPCCNLSYRVIGDHRGLGNKTPCLQLYEIYNLAPENFEFNVCCV